MPDLTSVEARIMAYPRAAIRKRVRDQAHISDNYATLIKRDWADAIGVSNAVNPTISAGWEGQPSFDSIDPHLAFVRFFADGSFDMGVGNKKENDQGAGDIAGFCVLPNVTPYNCTIGDTVPTSRGSSSQYETLEWVHTLPLLGNSAITAAYGNVSAWECVVPRDNQKVARLSHRVHYEKPVGCKTKKNRLANAGFCVDLQWLGLSIFAPPVAQAYLTWGQSCRIRFVQGQVPVFEQNDAQGEWVPVRRLDRAPITTFAPDEQVRVNVFLLGGKLVVQINGQGHFVVFKQTNPLDRTDVKPIAASWVAAPVALVSEGVQLTLGFSSLGFIWEKVKQIVPAVNGGKKTTREVGKAYDLKRSIEAGVRGGWETGFKLQPMGHFPPGTFTNTFALLRSNGLTYTASLRGSETQSPLLTGVTGHSQGTFSKTVIEGLDLRDAAKSLSIESASPPETADYRATIEVSRTLLEDIVAAKGVSLKTFVRRRNPIHIETRACYDDGTVGEWHTEFVGYISTDNKAIQSVNAPTLSLVCLGEISMRLQGAAALINWKYPPLDWFLFQNCVGDGSRVLWGGEAVQHLLRIALGDEPADSLNGNGDPLRYYANGHIPIMSADRDNVGISELTMVLDGSGVSTNGGFRKPAPFGSDVYKWIREDIAKMDFAVLFAESDGTIYYGRLTRFIAGRPVRIIPDNDYVTGDVNRLLQEASVAAKPEREFSTVEVQSNPPGTSMNGILPAVRMARAQVPPGDPLDPTQTWETTRLINDPRLWLPGVAEVTAQLQIKLTQGVEQEYPSLTVRYNPDERWHWGDLAQPKLESAYSDQSIELNGKTFRVERVRTTLDFIGMKYNCALSCRPLLANGL